MKKIGGFGGMFTLIITIFGLFFVSCEEPEPPVSYYTVFFTANGGTPKPEPQVVKEGDNFASPPMTKPGCIFRGWYFDEALTQSVDSQRVTRTMTLYAKWETITYNISYNINLGSGTPPDVQEVDAGDSIVLSDGSGFTRNGFSFGGWNTMRDGTGDNYAAGASYTPTGGSPNITLYAVWLDYTVSFDINGASGTGPNPIIRTGLTIRLPLLPVYPGDPALPGYAFTGWNTKADGTGTNYNPGQEYTPTGDITLYACWVPGYMITFDANGATGGTAPNPITEVPGSRITIPNQGNLTRDGYTFGGWNTEADGTGDEIASSYLINRDITVYATWCSRVTFDANGFGAAPNAIDVYDDSAITLPGMIAYGYEGRAFNGWNTMNDGTGTSYAAGDSYTPAGNITLYAQWLGAYSITYDSNDETTGTAPSLQTVAIGSSVTLPGKGTLERTGYTFGGWNTRSNGTGTNYAAGSLLTPTASIWLYARWYRAVTFDANGAASGNVPVMESNAGSASAITLPDQGNLIRTGYTFNGWNTKADGLGTSYHAGDSYTPPEDITLYARWYSTLSFNANGATGTTPPSQTVDSGSAITLPDQGDLIRTGCTFGGWNTLANGLGTNYPAGSSYTPEGNITLYAVWNCTVSFNANGATGSVPAWMPANAGFPITLPDQGALIQTGYTFGGWNTSADGIGTNYAAGSPFTPEGSTILYARWYSAVSFDANGAASGNVPVMEANFGSAITLPNQGNLAKTGYAFTGWNTSADGTGTPYAAGSSYTPAGNITLYANWVYICTVTFDANGATGGSAPAAMTANAGSAITLPRQGNLARTGYAFTGWNTSADGTGDNYSSSNNYTPTDDVTLYAKWVDKWIVSFDLNGGNGTPPSPLEVPVGGSITLPTNTGFSRPDSAPGSAFGGWLIPGNGFLTAGSSYTPTQNITLRARWYHTVTFNINGGSGTTPPQQEVTIGGMAYAPAASGFYMPGTTTNGYRFDTWNTLANGNGTNHGSGGYWLLEGNITLYAQWITTYTVTFDINGGTGPLPSPQTVDAGESLTLPSGAELRKQGYIFYSWGAINPYTPKQNITLYAQYR